VGWWRLRGGYEGCGLMWCRKREVNKKVLKVPEIEVKVRICTMVECLRRLGRRGGCWNLLREV
jgi:hypothetical protein